MQGAVFMNAVQAFSIPQDVHALNVRGSNLGCSLWGPGVLLPAMRGAMELCRCAAPPPSFTSVSCRCAALVESMLAAWPLCVDRCS